MKDRYFCTSHLKVEQGVKDSKEKNIGCDSLRKMSYPSTDITKLQKLKKEKARDRTSYKKTQ